MKNIIVFKNLSNSSEHKDGSLSDTNFTGKPQVAKHSLNTIIVEL